MKYTLCKDGEWPEHGKPEFGFSGDPPKFCRFSCPRGYDYGGCGIHIGTRTDNIPTWDWNGNKEAPTFTPSINCTFCGWHQNVTDGEFPDAFPEQKPEPR